jgi:hypothetical protein
MPYPASTTPGAATAPLTVARNVPGSCAVPADRNHATPCRAISAMCASVSTFWTSAPASVTRIRLSAGTAARPSTAATAAVSSPATNAVGAVRISTGIRSVPAPRRSLNAAASAADAAAGR